MGDSLSVRIAGVLTDSQETNWLDRVAENGRAALRLRKLAARLPNKSTLFGLLEFKPRPRSKRAQAASLVVHAAVFGALLYAATHIVSAKPRQIPPQYPGSGRILLPPLLVRTPADKEPRGGEGKGGGKNPLPPTTGELAARSRIQILPPRLPEEQTHLLLVEPTIQDENAPEIVKHIPDLGLPWMKDKNKSAGPGGPDGMGDKPGKTMGSGDRDGEGEGGPEGPYVRGVSRVKCLYCPDPEYTDAAREAKLQGSVTLVVQVTADGKAGQVRLVRGLGLGLDERAVETVRKWKFLPAQDAARRPISEWVTVEALYRLF